MIKPSVCAGDDVLKSVAMKMKPFGEGRQLRVLLSEGVPLTRSILRLNNVPGPESGVVPSFENADTRRILIGPGPARTFPATVQPLAVSPAASTIGLEKDTTVESKVKSPWKPTYSKPGSMVVTVTGSKITVEIGTEMSKVSIGSETVGGVGEGVGVSVGVGEAVATGVGVSVGVGEAVAAGVGVSVGVGDAVGAGVGVSVGIGDAVGAGVGVSVGVGEAVGAGVGVSVGVGVGLDVGEGVGVAAVIVAEPSV